MERINIPIAYELLDPTQDIDSADLLSALTRCRFPSAVPERPTWTGPKVFRVIVFLQNNRDAPILAAVSVPDGSDKAAIARQLDIMFDECPEASFVVGTVSRVPGATTTYHTRKPEFFQVEKTGHWGVETLAAWRVHKHCIAHHDVLHADNMYEIVQSYFTDGHLVMHDVLVPLGVDGPTEEQRLNFVRKVLEPVAGDQAGKNAIVDNEQSRNIVSGSRLEWQDLRGVPDARWEPVRHPSVDTLELEAYEKYLQLKEVIAYNWRNLVEESPELSPFAMLIRLAGTNGNLSHPAWESVRHHGYASDIALAVVTQKLEKVPGMIWGATLDRAAKTLHVSLTVPPRNKRYGAKVLGQLPYVAEVLALHDDARSARMLDAILEQQRADMQRSKEYRGLLYHPGTMLADSLPALDDLPPAPQPAGLTVTLARSQRVMLGLMLRRETTEAPGRRLWVPTLIANPADGQRLMYSPLLGTFALSEMTLGGGLYCDTMGLGKTVTTIALALANPGGTTLVCCPPAIIKQWIGEVRAKAPGLRVVALNLKKPATWMDPDVDFVVAPHSALCKADLRQRTWHRVVVDESHLAPLGHTAGPGHTSFPAATLRWCLSATPIPQKITTRIVLGWLNDRQLRFLGLTAHIATVPWVCAVLRLLAVGHITAPPDAVSAQLPPVQSTVHEVVMEPAQAEVYTATLASCRAIVAAKPTVWVSMFNVLREIAAGGRVDPLKIDRALHRATPGARVTDDDPGAFVSSGASPDPDGTCALCLDVFESPVVTRACAHWFCRECISSVFTHANVRVIKCPLCRHGLRDTDFKAPAAKRPADADADADAAPPIERGGVFPAKAAALAEILAALPAGSKALVFSQFQGCLDYCKTMPCAAGGVCISGAASAASRGAAIDKFSSDPGCRVMLLNVRAAAAGINLTAADHVIFMEPVMNGAQEAQAIARAHRQGQTKQVRVVRLIAKDTIEEALLESPTDAASLLF